MTSNNVYVVMYDTESGDSGVFGVFKTHPTTEQLDEIASREHQDDYEADCLYLSDVLEYKVYE